MFDPIACRAEFPALARTIGKKPVIYFDGPAGSQVPGKVIEAIYKHLIYHNANHGGLFATSLENDAIIANAHQAVADLLGAESPDQIIFGPNMTTLAFALSRAIATSWGPGDEVMVTHLDHDANVSPWVRAAHDRGATVRYVGIHPEDCTLDLEDFERKLSPRTRLVALGCVSNAVGTRNPIEKLIPLAHQAVALVFLDAVHHAPHASIDVTRWDCDFLACSSYKFFGPHVGILYGKRKLLEDLPAYKVRPAPESLPDRWMTGTQNFACIAGAGAAVEYLRDLGGPALSLPRESLRRAFTSIEAYEQDLSRKLLSGLASIPEVRVWGITDPTRLGERVPTVSITHARHKPREVAEYLGNQGIFVWHGNFYALPLTEALGLEPDGMVRIGLLHYNTAEEIDRLVSVLGTLK